MPKFLMLQDHSFSSVVPRKYFRSSALMTVIAAAFLLGGNVAWADQGKSDMGVVRLLKTVPIPGTTANTTNGKLYSFDISFVDQSTQTYYLTISPIVRMWLSTSSTPRRRGLSGRFP
jgi:hypothetical protein